jgi:hypothetical protein
MTNEPEIISIAKPKKQGPGMAMVGDGTIGSTKVNTAKPRPEVAVQSNDPEQEKVAVYSSRNVSWDGVGTIKRGYNIMTKTKAEKWLTRMHTYLATPEEVAKEFDL